MNTKKKHTTFAKVMTTLALVLTMAYLLVAYTPLKAYGFEWLLNQNEQVEELTDEDMQALADVYYAIQSNYIDDVDKKTLLEGALKGMVGAVGDPYSEYLNAQETEGMNETVEGSFQGVGVQFMSNNGQIQVVTPIDDTPASRAGILPNDIILEADGTELTGMDTNEVVALIRGEVGTTVTLLIQRGDATFEVELERAEIPIITVTGELDEADATIGNVKISQFNGTTYDELVKVIESLRTQGAKSFVFDLRYNPGGLLDQGLAISNMFLEDDEIMMQMEEGGNPDATTTYVASDKEYGDFQITEPYVVLVNDGSASASEILTAAIKENTDAPIVGVTTFGKGSVQTIINQTELGELKLTFAKWLTPSGEWIHDKGIEPTNVVEPEPLETAVQLNAEEELSIGMANEYVTSLIHMLQAFGYEVDEGTYFDEKVQTAVQKFQKDNQLEETGTITSETASLMNTMARDYIEAHDVQYDAAVEILKDMAKEDNAA